MPSRFGPFTAEALASSLRPRPFGRDKLSSENLREGPRHAQVHGPGKAMRRPRWQCPQMFSLVSTSLPYRRIPQLHMWGRLSSARLLRGASRLHSPQSDSVGSSQRPLRFLPSSGAHALKCVAFQCPAGLVLPAAPAWKFLFPLPSKPLVLRVVTSSSKLGRLPQSVFLREIPVSTVGPHLSESSSLRSAGRASAPSPARTALPELLDFSVAPCRAPQGSKLGSQDQRSWVPLQSGAGQEDYLLVSSGTGSWS